MNLTIWLRGKLERMTEDEFDELMEELGIPEENIIRTKGDGDDD